MRKIELLLGSLFVLLMLGGPAIRATAGGHAHECGHCAALQEAQALTPDPLDHVAPSRNFRTVHTALDLDIELEQQHIAGSVTHTLQCLRNSTTELLLNSVALDLEAQQSPQPNWDEMQSRFKALEAELERVKQQLGELEQRVPPPAGS